MARKKNSDRKSDKKPIEQYEHKGKKRVNNPPVGLVTPETDKDTEKKKYVYDPHIDPQLEWAGKAEHASFEIHTVSLHVHERIDPRTIIEAVRKRNGSEKQGTFFESWEENPPLREAIEFYKHKHNWSNRFIAGDSLLVMNSLIEKEGLAGQVQMIYIDPPYGIKYGSNFQPFVNNRDVKDGKDEDLTQEPEMIKAFRDTWELGIHSYLTYLRDRLLLAKELLTESGSIFVQISDENVHLVRCLMDEEFGAENFISNICFQKIYFRGSTYLDNVNDTIIWYGKDTKKTKFRQLYKILSSEALVAKYKFKDTNNGNFKEIETVEEFELDKCFFHDNLLSPGDAKDNVEIDFGGKRYSPHPGYHWKTTKNGLIRLKSQNRLIAIGSWLKYKRYAKDFPIGMMNNIWTDTVPSTFAEKKLYVVQTYAKVIARCILMTTDPGDLVFDPTCGSGTTAYVAEQWGRRWITCDTSRVAITLAKQRLMTALYDYYELAHPQEGVGSGFRYRTVPHITLKSIANNEPPGQETLYDQPFVDSSRARVTGPFTVEAVPSPVVKPLGEIASSLARNDIGRVDESIARSGETLRQAEWRAELLKCGIRGKKGQYIQFSRVEPLGGTRWLHAEAETKPNDLGANTVRERQPVYGQPQRVVISFGPEHAPIEQRQVELAWEEARKLVPRPTMIIFAAFQFDPESAKDID